MKKTILFSGRGQRADMGPVSIDRVLPNRYVDTVGSFVFLDHLLPKTQTSFDKSNSGAHPHRGIATLTYVLDGEDEHFDSAGNYAKVYSGGVQWMKAGNGIVHDESLGADTRLNTMRIHAFQFWINLPGKIKAEKPEYMAVQADAVPQKLFEEGSGWIKVIVGNYEQLSAAIPNYLEQFLYHLHLEPGARFTLPVKEGMEAAAFLPSTSVVINDAEFTAGEWVSFDQKAGNIDLHNTSAAAADVLLFGGETYQEPIVSKGPFVMNSQAEITQAYHEYNTGKYGTIQPVQA